MLKDLFDLYTLDNRLHKTNQKLYSYIINKKKTTPVGFEPTQNQLNHIPTQKNWNLEG